MNAYVLIQSEAHETPLAHRLRSIPGVVSADDVNGAYDAVALVEARSTRHLAEEIIRDIQRIPGVTRALPAPVLGSLRSASEPVTVGAPRASGEQAA